MSTETFNKENLDRILNELSKEYKKLGGKKMPAEIVLIGGAAVIENYGFRDMTTDIDAVIDAASMMKEAINHVGDRLNLPNGWLNDDFKKTDSYSKSLSEISVYYRTFSGVLNVRTVSAEYLIAMKLKAGRKYKNDLSDVVGILAEHKAKGDGISYDKIDSAMVKLYGGWGNVPEDSIVFIKDLMVNGDYASVFEDVRKNEKLAKEMLIDFEDKYPGVAKTDNVDDILRSIKKKEETKASILDKLRQIEEQKNDSSEN